MHRWILGSTLAVILTTAATPDPAVAATDVLLVGQSRSGGMIVDPVHHHVIVAGDVGEPTLVVDESDGSLVGTVPPGGGSEGLGFALAGTTLYVGRCGGGSIDAVDTATLAVADSFDAAVESPCDLALTGGRIWSAASFGDLRSVLAAPPHTATFAPAVAGLLQAVPGHPTWLVTSDRRSIDVLDVSDPSAPVALAEKRYTSPILVRDMKVTADGGHLEVVTDADTKPVTQLSLPGLNLETTYKSGAGTAVAIAVSPDGSKIATASEDETIRPHTAIFATGVATPLATFDLGNGVADVAGPRGLAFSEDGKKLLDVTLNDSVGSTLHFLPAQIPSITIKTSSGVITAGGSVTLTAHIASPTIGRSLAIYRRPAGSSPVLVTSGTVDAGGNLTAKVRPLKNTTYTAVFAGDDTFAAPARPPAVTVGVRVHITTQTTNNYATRRGYHLFHYSTSCASVRHTRCPGFSTTTMPVRRNARVLVTLQRHGAAGWRTVSRSYFRTNRFGKLHLIFAYSSTATIGRAFRVEFAMRADAENATSASRWAYFTVTH